MNLKPIGSNQTEVETEKFKILFSYKTPVACLNKFTLKYYQTTTKWSVTTSRHINKWLHGIKAFPMEQNVLDALV